jgi:hypothetical protein
MASQSPSDIVIRQSGTATDPREANPKLLGKDSTRSADDPTTSMGSTVSGIQIHATATQVVDSKVALSLASNRKEPGAMDNHPNRRACPRCGEPEQHCYHVIKCTQDAAQHTWQASLNKLDRWLTHNHTRNDLHSGILEGLRSWHDDRPTLTTESDWPTVEQALNDQQALGWHLFFDGFIAQSWMAIQQSYLEFLSKKMTGKRWLSRLIIQLWEVTWDMWRHRMKIVHTIDSQSLIAQMATLDIQVQERFDCFYDQPSPAMQRWFNQPANNVALESLDLKQQWLTMVDAAWAFYH